MLSYSLVVAKGYVRLVRTGSRPSRPRVPTSFVRRNGMWVEREPDPADVDNSDPLDDDAWADGPDQVDPDVATSCTGDCTRAGVTVACRPGAG